MAVLRKVFIQANNKQKIGALLAAFALTKTKKAGDDYEIEIVNVDELDLFKRFSGKTYFRKGKLVTYNPNDLQSFTLSRFIPPQLMGYKGRAVVIDPDIFAVQNIGELFFMNLEGKAIACCPRKNAWDTSVMIMDCEKLSQISLEKMLADLEEKREDYDSIMTLKKEKSILPLSRIWNNLDTLTSETKLLHTTNRLTQPWKTGLPIDFTMNPLPKFFGIIPREPFFRLLGKIPNTYQPHPDKKIERFFFSLAKEALDQNFITEDMIQEAIKKSFVRKDFLLMISSLTND